MQGSDHEFERCRMILKDAKKLEKLKELLRGEDGRRLRIGPSGPLAPKQRAHLLRLGSWAASWPAPLPVPESITPEILARRFIDVVDQHLVFKARPAASADEAFWNWARRDAVLDAAAVDKPSGFPKGSARRAELESPTPRSAAIDPTSFEYGAFAEFELSVTGRLKIKYADLAEEEIFEAYQAAAVRFNKRFWIRNSPETFRGLSRVEAALYVETKFEILARLRNRSRCQGALMEDDAKAPYEGNQDAKLAEAFLKCMDGNELPPVEGVFGDLLKRHGRLFVLVEAIATDPNEDRQRSSRLYHIEGVVRNQIAKVEGVTREAIHHRLHTNWTYVRNDAGLRKALEEIMDTPPPWFTDDGTPGPEERQHHRTHRGPDDQGLQGPPASDAWRALLDEVSYRVKAIEQTNGGREEQVAPVSEEVATALELVAALEDRGITLESLDPSTQRRLLTVLGPEMLDEVSEDPWTLARELGVLPRRCPHRDKLEGDPGRFMLASAFPAGGDDFPTMMVADVPGFAEAQIGTARSPRAIPVAPRPRLVETGQEAPLGVDCFLRIDTGESKVVLDATISTVDLRPMTHRDIWSVVVALGPSGSAADPRDMDPELYRRGLKHRDVIQWQGRMTQPGANEWERWRLAVYLSQPYGEEPLLDGPAVFKLVPSDNTFVD